MLCITSTITRDITPKKSVRKDFSRYSFCVKLVQVLVPSQGFGQARASI
jgi:hypothetical protein